MSPFDFKMAVFPAYQQEKPPFMKHLISATEVVPFSWTGLRLS